MLARSSRRGLCSCSRARRSRLPAPARQWARRPGVAASRGGEDGAADASADAGGSVWGSALLVAGTTIGAGILALPAVTQDAGFVPSCVALTGACAFSIATGLLVAETALNTMAEQQQGGSVSLISMSRRSFGPAGVAGTSVIYGGLHYALLVAYIAKAGEIIAGATGLPVLAADAGFAGGLAVLCLLSSQQVLDAANGALVALVVASFVGLLAVAAPGVDAGSLAMGDWAAVAPTLPVIALSFVYHNVTPVVVKALRGDARRITTAIVAGVSIPWLMFVAWEAAILGSLGSLGPEQQQQLPPPQQQQQDQQGLLAAGTPAPPLVDAAAQQAAASPASRAPHVADPLAALSAASPSVAPLIQSFSLLAIGTSFIGFILGLTDFLADGLRLPSRQAPLPYALTVLPPFAVAVVNPNIFLAALNVAGAYGVLTLFGVLPPAMAWRERYGQPGRAAVQLVPGGRPVLLLVGGAAAAVIINASLTQVGA